MKIRALLIPLVLSLMAGAAHSETLRLLNWEEYLSPTVETQWENKTGHKIESVFFDNDQKRDEILLNAEHHIIDLAVVDEIVAERFGEDQRLIEITEELVPNLKHVGKFWRQRCSKYAIPYFWGTLGIVYRSDKVPTPPDSWRDIVEPSDKLKGHIGMLDDYTDMLAPAIFMNGHKLNTEDADELKQAFEVLKQQSADVLTYDYIITYVDSSPKSDDLHMAVGYGGDQYILNERAGNDDLWKYVIPKEGTVLWVDCLAIPSNSKNIKQALTFLNYLSDPVVAAQHAEDLYYATPNEAAMNHVSDKYKNDSEIFPPRSILAQSDLYEEMTNSNIEKRLRITNAVKNIHESKQTR
ncbi:ABC transporter substrate-binding protein [Neptuniibacter sp.]|uniref:ABC transporter substrate-binding protein n=1 Tax=Neptuniibacter sp. TaxID=1962643 RepID=UPI003B5CA5B9